MKQSRLMLGVAGAAFASLFTGCIDDAYDLSDIDTTSRIDVKDLTIPVNIDKVTLDDIIDFDENSKIKSVNIGGEEFYALTETGEFHSDPIHIAEVHAAAPNMTPTIETLDIIPLKAYKGKRAPSELAISYGIKEMGNDFSYEAHNIDKSIENLTSAKVDNVTFEIELSAPDLGSIASHIYFRDLRIQLPKGMNALVSTGKYDRASGIWTIPEHNVEGTRTSISIKADEINLADNGAVIDKNSHSLTLKSKFKVLDGTLIVEPKIGNTLPQRISFRADYKISPLDITAISGTINYQLEGININPVYLGDIPDFLNQEGTNLMLSNPQIYLSINNPLSGYSLKGNTGLTLTANRPNAPEAIKSLSYSLDNGPVVIGYDKGNGPYRFVLSPSANGLNYPDGYSAANTTHYSFSGLSDILAVPEGYASYSELPNSIGIDLSEPCLPSQKVTDFKLNTDLDAFQGKYELVAPLDLKPGSIIIYSTTEDGWNDADVDAIVIEQLTLNALADNNIPLGADLVAYPLDYNGNRIPDVKVESNTLPASTEGFPIEIKLTGEVRHLDGIIFEARIRPGENSKPLAPSQTIQLRNIRAKVSGYYIKKL